MPRKRLSGQNSLREQKNSNRSGKRPACEEQGAGAAGLGQKPLNLTRRTLEDSGLGMKEALKFEHEG